MKVILFIKTKEFHPAPNQLSMVLFHSVNIQEIPLFLYLDDKMALWLLLNINLTQLTELA